MSEHGNGAAISCNGVSEVTIMKLIQRKVFFAAIAFMLFVASAPLFSGATHAETVTYTYDDNGRLAKADYGSGNSVTFAYDLAGNILSAATHLPAVTTAAVSLVTDTTATAGGNATSSGGAAITARGVCWSAAANPTTSDSCAPAASGGAGSFTIPVTGLSPNSRYHVRAYAVNSRGTGYGNDVVFSTGVSVASPAGGNIILTSNCPGCSFSVVKAFTSAQLEADPNIYTFPYGIVQFTLLTHPGQSVDVTVTYPAGANLSGHVYRNYGPATPGGPIQWYNLGGATVSGSSATLHLQDNANGDSVTLPGVLVNLGGAALAPTLPTVTTTSPVTNIATTAATAGGNVTSDGRAPVTRGVCFSTAANPTTQDRCVAGGTGAGTFTINVIGLTPSTPYHARAYATNVVGTSYGADVTFTTLTPVLPSLTTWGVSKITVTTASGGGTITYDGGTTVTARGVCWGKTANPTLLDNCFLHSSGGGGGFAALLTGLSANTEYHVRAYATNQLGTAYGNDIQFKTSSGTGPFAYVRASSSVVVIDTATNLLFGEGIFTGTGVGIAVNHSGNRVYAAVTGNNRMGVAVIDAATNTLVAPQVSVGNQPAGIAVNPAATRVYVTNQMDDTVSVINAATNTLLGSPISVGSSPLGIAVNPAGTKVYVANSMGNTVSVIDAVTNTVSGSPIAVGNNPAGLALNPAGTRLYVANSGDNNVSVIDTATNTIVGSPVTVGAKPYGVAVNPAGTMAYVTNQDGGSVSFIDLTTTPPTTSTPITGRQGPTGVAVNPAGTRLYVTESAGNNLSIIDLTANPPAVFSGIGLYQPRALGQFIGPAVSFIPPTVTTATGVSKIRTTTARGGGTVTSAGSSTVTARGICWSTAPSPVLGGNCVSGGAGTGSFTGSMTGLNPGTPYHVRAYATNASGTGYGSDVHFTTAQPAVQQLSVNIAGSGDGTVTSTPPGISCGKAFGPCNASFDQDLPVILMSSANTDSIFSLWSACAALGNCTVTMDTDKTVTATFNYVMPVKVVSTGQGYNLIQNAFTALTAAGTIMAREHTFTEASLILNKPGLSVLLKGGYDTGYAGNSGYTTLKGRLTIQSGALTVERLVIK
jgi:YVTN family beta-propeller protein/YD repeat-containing protein